MHLAQLDKQPGSPWVHAETSTAPGNRSLPRVGTAPIPRILPANQLRSTGSSTGTQQTRVASVSAVTRLHAATSSTGHFSLPQVISGTSLSRAAVQSAQDSTLPSGPLGDLKLPTSVPVPNKPLTINSARHRRSYQQLCMAPLSPLPPFSSCNLTTSPLSDPRTSEGAAAPQLDMAAYAQQPSAQLQVHAETWSLSIPASNLAGFSPELADGPNNDCYPSPTLSIKRHPQHTCLCSLVDLS